MDKNDYFILFIRITLVVLYPLWLMVLLVDCKEWGDFKESAILPFTKWNKHSSNKTE